MRSYISKNNANDVMCLGFQKAFGEVLYSNLISKGEARGIENIDNIVHNWSSIRQ